MCWRGWRRRIGLGMLFRGENTGKLVVRVAEGQTDHTGGNDAM